MGSAYTPGLTVSRDIVVQRVRRLPIKGEVAVKPGDKVGHDTVVARAMLPGILQTIRLAEKLGVEAKEVPGFFHLQVGDPIGVGQQVAETPGFFGLFKQPVISDFAGTVETISEVTGHVLVREPSIPVDVTAYLDGSVIDVMPEEGAVIETRGAMVQGIFGIGGERNGPIRIAVSSADEVLDAGHIKPDDAGKILVGGSGVTYEALEKANNEGVVGLVVGAVRDVDITKFLGYDIGVAITGQEPINVTLICTEGFGVLRMADRTFELLKSIEGRTASLNGATQIRAGVIRPEVIAPSDSVSGEGQIASSGGTLEPGTPIRIIREPYFGLLGKVTGLPAQLVTVESGAEVRVLNAKLDDGREVTVPRANVEIIALS
ncbi:MAG: hypothetical protein KF884_10205 [Fimbriimonadaceae bacterium]|nr:hypothetical protein [Fimbriimonadaceae bacterium]QYK57919.1 MAG: hypothetical protein KF884_10205 [Fimbriimonadaceae bacterium]